MDPRTFWDDKFAPERYAYGETPNAFLAWHAGSFPAEGKLLSLGEGEGRNAVFLAGRGYDVTAIDASPRGLSKLKRLAEAKGVKVTGIEADVNTFTLGTERWDGIYNIYCHLEPEARQALYARIRAALKPGGVFLTEQFAKDQLGNPSGGPKDERLLLSLEELQEAFKGDEVLYAAHQATTLDEGPLHQGPASVIRFIVRKPAAAK